MRLAYNVLGGEVNNNMMTNAQTNRRMNIIAPTSAYTVPPQTNVPSTADRNATRDDAGCVP
jgi:hypothetical protein